MKGTGVTIERRGSVQLIALDRPDKLNAVNAIMSRAVAEAIDELDTSDDLRVGVLTGVGDNFSTGMDLDAFARGENPNIKGRGFAGITASSPSKPLIGAAHGWALGGGFELLLACDLIVADSTAVFGFPEVKRSMVAAAGGALILPRRIPFAIAMEMLISGHTINATRAYELGLLNRLVPPGEAVAVAIDLASDIAANGPLAVAATKLIARATYDWSLPDAWEQQRRLVEPVHNSNDAREGAKAFVEKREPRWTGK
jgi:enoyl-CoA hydratase